MNGLAHKSAALSGDKRAVQALVLSSNGVRQADFLPKPLEKGEVQLRMELAAICRTDVFVALQMREAPEGIILGHEGCGTIWECSEHTSGFSRGTRVAFNPIIGCGSCNKCTEGRFHLCPAQRFIGLDCDGCYSPFFNIPARNVYPIPDSVTWQEAAYLEPLAATLAILNEPLIYGSKVALVGKSRIADIAALVLQSAEISFERLSLPEEGERLSGTAVGSYDVVIETSASRRMLKYCIDLLRPRGTLILKSRPQKFASLDLNAALKKEIRLHSCAYGDFEQALHLIETRRVDLRPFCGEIFPLSDFEIAFQLAFRDEHKKYFFSLHNDVRNSCNLLSN